MPIPRFKKTTAIALVALQGLLLTAPLAQALPSSNPNKYAGKIEQRYNINQGSMQDMGQSFNVSQNKKMVPEVDLFFSPADPVPGKKITASAYTLNFNNPNSNLYFTWYLKRNFKDEQIECSLDRDPSSLKRSLCDENDDGRITVEDWKVAAMKILARGGWEPNDARLDPNNYADPDALRDAYYQLPHEDPDIATNNLPNNDKDNDGYEAFWGGHNAYEKERKGNPDGVASCYTHDFNTGTTYELDDVIIGGSALVCPTGQKAVCVNSDDLFDGSSITQECSIESGNPICGSDGTVSCNAGIPACVPDDTSGTVSESSCADAGLTAPSCPTGDDDVYGEWDGHAGSWDTCGGEGISVTEITDPAAGPYTCQEEDNFTCIDAWAQIRTRYDSETGEEVDYISHYASRTVTCAANQSAVTPQSCQHLFPYDYELENDGSVHIKRDSDNNRQRVATGDKQFTTREEKFWGTNHLDPSTADNGNQDEANLAGLGQDSFTWTYQEGDEVGVAVEGVSMVQTKYDDASKMVMWALPNNDCTERAIKENIAVTSSKHILSKGYNVEIPTIALDLNECLPWNLVDPQEKGSEKLEIDLVATPDDPINDPTTDAMGDLVLVNAFIENASTGSAAVNYRWKVEIDEDGTNPRPDEWEGWRDITTLLTQKKQITPTSGANLDSLSFNLNLTGSDLASLRPLGFSQERDYVNHYFPGGVGYLRVVLDATENVNDQRSRQGRQVLLLKVVSTYDRIEVYKVRYDEISGTLSPDVRICHEDVETRALCYVTPLEIVAVRLNTNSNLTKLSWTINGMPLNCTREMSPECSNNTESNIAYFPATGEIGDVHTVVMTGIEESEFGKEVELVRTFKIIDPYVEIASANEDSAWGRLSGVFEDPLGQIARQEDTYDQSDRVIQTYPGNTLTLRSVFHPSFLSYHSPADPLDDPAAQFIVDSQLAVTNFYDDPEGRRIFTTTFTADKPIGNAYAVSLKAAYITSPSSRRALYDIWGITAMESGEKILPAAVQVEVVADPNLANAPLTARKMVASLLMHVPEYALFFIRLVLTALIILFVTGLIHSAYPQRYGEEDDWQEAL